MLKKSLAGLKIISGLIARDGFTEVLSQNLEINSNQFLMEMRVFLSSGYRLQLITNDAEIEFEGLVSILPNTITLNYTEGYKSNTNLEIDLNTVNDIKTVKDYFISIANSGQAPVHIVAIDGKASVAMDETSKCYFYDKQNIQFYPKVTTHPGRLDLDFSANTL